MAGYYFSNKNYKKALEAYDKCIEIDNTDSYLYETRATIKKDLKDSGGALIDYKKALELNPNIADFCTYLDISDIYKNLNNLEKALEYIDLAIENCPPEDLKYYDMYSDKARLLESLEKFEQSLEAQLKHDEIWLNEFGEIQSYNTTGYRYYKLKQYKQALKYFNKAIKKNNNDYVAYLNKSCVFLDTKKFKRVIKICHYALSLSLPKESEYGFYMDKGLAYYYLKDFDNALKDFKISIKENPKYLDGRVIKAYTEHLLGKTNKAIKDIKKLIEKLPDNYIYLGYLLAIYYSQKRFSEVIEICDEYLKTKQKNNIYIFKALALKAIGNVENFKINLKKALESDKSLTEESIAEKFEEVYNIKLEKLNNN